MTSPRPLPGADRAVAAGDGRRSTGAPSGVPVGMVALAALAALGLLAGAAPAGAQLAVDRSEIELAPGGRTRVELIAVRNDGERPVQAIVRLEDWDRDERGTNRWHPHGTRPGSCGAALSVFPGSLVLAPGAAATVRVALDSAAAPSRECWSAAIVETVQPRTEGTRSVAYVLRTAVKLYVVPDGLPVDGEVADLRLAPAEPPAPGTPAPGAPAPTGATQLALTFANTGGRHLVARGTLELRRPDDTVAATVAVPTLYVLPGARVATTVPLPALPAGRYVALVTFDYAAAELAAAQLDVELP